MNRLIITSLLIFLLFIPFASAVDPEPYHNARIMDGDGTNKADVILDSGVNKLAVLADINITAESSVAKDLNPDSWCEVTNAGSSGDTVTISISDDSCSSVTTLTSTEAGDVVATAELIVSDFNTESSCNDLYEATQVDDNGVVVIAAKIINGIAERPDSGDFSCEATGTTTVLEGFDNILSRNKLIRCIPDKNDPRVCATNVTGQISVLPAPINKHFTEYLKNGSSSDMLVDGSSTPVTFTYTPTEIKYITQIRCFGGGNGIKFAVFLSKNIPLANGIEFTIQTGGDSVTLKPVTTTEDWKNLFSFPSATDFRIDVQSGADQFIAIHNSELPFALDPTYSDYVQAKVQDDLTSGVIQLECLVSGFSPEE